jgi:hypothetical protein
MHGLLESARKFPVKLAEALKNCGFKGHQADPFLLIKN